MTTRATVPCRPVSMVKTGEFPYKALAIDLDGTLLTSAETITMETSKVLMQLFESGIIIILASGRSVELQACFAPCLPPLFHMVAFNGGVVAEYRNGKSCVYHQIVLDTSIVFKIVEALTQHEVPFFVYDGDVCVVASTSLAEALRREGITNQKQSDDLSCLAQSRELLKIALPLGRVEPIDFEEGRAAAQRALGGLDLPGLGVQVLPCCLFHRIPHQTLLFTTVTP